MNQAEARTVFWDSGRVALWYLRPSQLDVYDLLENERYPFVEAGRRFGKTTSILCFVMEKLLQNPGWITRWCFPEKNLAMEVIGKELPKVQQMIPDAKQFHFRTKHSVFIHPNGSELYLRGVNEDKGRSARGPASNIIVCDEYGFWNDPEYVVKDALYPQLENQQGRWLIKTSTPPPNMGHRYYIEHELAERKGRLITKTIYDNEALAKEELDEIIEECGGVTSISFRRERLCEHITDPSMLVVPEYNDISKNEDGEIVDWGHVIPDDTPRPDFFSAWVGGDSGADDLTALIFAYYDFENAKLVYDDEVVVNGQTTGIITRLAKCKELELWAHDRELWSKVQEPLLDIQKEKQLHTILNTAFKLIDEQHNKFMASMDPVYQHPKKRVYDADKQLIFDLYGSSYSYPMQMAQKKDKISAIHKYRNEWASGRIQIKERCKHTRRQHKVGIWKDETKKDFQRTEGLGHLDCISAGLYLNRSIDRNFNPIPPTVGVNRQTQHVPAGLTRQTVSETEKVLGNIFGGRR